MATLDTHQHRSRCIISNLRQSPLFSLLRHVCCDASFYVLRSYPEQSIRDKVAYELVSPFLPTRNILLVPPWTKRATKIKAKN